MEASFAKESPGMQLSLQGNHICRLRKSRQTLVPRSHGHRSGRDTWAWEQPSTTPARAPGMTSARMGEAPLGVALSFVAEAGSLAWGEAAPSPLRRR